MSDQGVTSEDLNKLLDDTGLSYDNVKERRLYWDMWSYIASQVKIFSCTFLVVCEREL